MAKGHLWPGRPQTPSTVDALFSLFLPLLRSYVYPTFLLPTQTPRRDMGVDVLAPTSKAPPHLRLNTLSTIEHLELLDLLGAPHPLVRSYFPDTAWLFDVFVSAEMRLRDVGFLDGAALGGSFFHTRAAGDISLAYMGDDHLPFCIMA
jgi:hypothetical protein